MRKQGVELQTKFNWNASNWTEHKYHKA